MTSENREYKDSVFCDLFYSDQDAKKNLLELYNALFDSDYTDPEQIRLVRLEDVLFKNFKNDVAFTMNGERIILSEHQSTINLNMPLRDLMYIAREYELLVPAKKRYEKKQMKIPTPVFYTFYNGNEDYPTETELQLSDMYENPSEPALELKVKVININKNKNHKILEKCKVMKEYSEFVEKTRVYKEDRETLKNVVTECIKEGVLKDYLERKGTEVINMLMTKYDYDTDIAVQREEARQEGIEEGIQEGILRVITNMRSKGFTIFEIADILGEPQDVVESLLETEE
ncbi:MAG: Rpn family recombination-promoting nuclease/putative transposase [Blautia sp.]|nr:Rpn family recombination-promoting nuclease/putative transposase [Blautia sp.]